jgi:hypothetical protein
MFRFAVVIEIAGERAFVSREFSTERRARGWAAWWLAKLAPTQGKAVTVAVFEGGAGGERIWSETFGQTPAAVIAGGTRPSKSRFTPGHWTGD